MAWSTNPTSRIVGVDYIGHDHEVGVQDGHLEVRISDPDGWGGVSVVEAQPLIQESFAYGTGPRIFNTVSGTGTVTTLDSLMSCSTGVDVGAYATCATALAHYRAGMELIYEFSAKFTTGVASSVQIAGPHTGGDGAGFGYNGTSFGILTRKGGKRAVAVLTISAASTAAATGTITLNGTGFTTPSLTNVGSTAGTATEIAAGAYAGWTAQAVGSTVVFVAVAVGIATAGTYTFTHATAAGTFPANTVTTNGAAVTETWTPQASWNMERMDGTQHTPTVLDPTKLNVYRIRMRFLGGVGFLFDVYDSYSHHWTPVQRPTTANVETTPFVLNPSLPMRWTVGSLGSTTNIVVSGASCKVAIGGTIDGTPITRAASGYNAAVSTTLIPLMSVSVATAFNSVQPSFIGAILNTMGAASYHSRPVAIHLLKNAVLSGARFTRISSDAGMLSDTSATAISGGTTLLILPLGPDGEMYIPTREFGFRLEPGETWTLAAICDSGTGADVRGTLTFQELW